MSSKAIPDNPPPEPSQSRRILFLDDDPVRAEIFLAENPEAVWVQTVEDCIANLKEEWDEVHLDHDLGGERFVDQSRDDCGMAVVRWLCLEPHPHLHRTQFLVHSHNPVAARSMAMQIYVAGFHVENRPFGYGATLPVAGDPFWNPHPLWRERLLKLGDLVLRTIGRMSARAADKPSPPERPAGA